MITHYDMMTGQVIEDETHDRPMPEVLQPDMIATPRLLSVQEATASRTPGLSLPADAAMLSVEALIARGS